MLPTPILSGLRADTRPMETSPLEACPRVVARARVEKASRGEESHDQCHVSAMMPSAYGT